MEAAKQISRPAQSCDTADAFLIPMQIEIASNKEASPKI